MKQNKQTKSAFTLVELIVVMAIIGILTAIAVPRFTAFIQTARDTAIIGEADSVYSALLVSETQLLAEGTPVTSLNLVNGAKDTLPSSVTLLPAAVDLSDDDHSWAVEYDTTNPDMPSIKMSNKTGNGTYDFEDGELVEEAESK